MMYLLEIVSLVGKVARGKAHLERYKLAKPDVQ
jgi:hypothetical protein